VSQKYIIFAIKAQILSSKVKFRYWLYVAFGNFMGIYAYFSPKRSIQLNLGLSKGIVALL
jgi:hypothetical protein